MSQPQRTFENVDLCPNDLEGLPDALPGRPHLVAIINDLSNQNSRSLLLNLLNLKSLPANRGEWKCVPQLFKDEAELRSYMELAQLNNNEVVVVVMASTIRRPSRQFGWGAKEFKNDADWQRLNLPDWVRNMPHVLIINGQHNKLDFRSMAGTIRSTFFSDEFDRRLDDDSQEIYGHLATSENPTSGLTPAQSYALRRDARKKHSNLERGQGPIVSLRAMVKKMAKSLQRAEKTSHT